MVHAQSVSRQTQYLNHFEIKPMNLIGGQYNLNYERVLNNRWTAEAGYGHIFGTEIDNQTISGNSFLVSGHYYFTKKHLAPESYYVGPYLSFHSLSSKTGQDTDDINFSEQGVLVGRQWLQKNGIVLDTNVGIGHLFHKYDEVESDDTYEEDTPIFIPRVAIAIGYSF